MTLTMGEGAALDNEGYGRRGRKSGVQAWTPNLPYAGPLACGDSDAPAHCPQGAVVKHTSAPTPPSFRRLSPRETPSLSSCVSRRYGACERRAAHARHLRMGHCMPSRKNMSAHRVYDCAADYGASPRAWKGCNSGLPTPNLTVSRTVRRSAPRFREL